MDKVNKVFNKKKKDFMSAAKNLSRRTRYIIVHVRLPLLVVNYHNQLIIFRKSRRHTRRLLRIPSTSMVEEAR